MTIERRNPLKPAPVEVKSVVTAGNFDLPGVAYQSGLCPECGKAMTVTRCDDIPSYVCMDHRIVLPVELSA